jgi:alkylation response protein AidB-like acyl-CoA dehydrogenase
MWASKVAIGRYSLPFRLPFAAAWCLAHDTSDLAAMAHLTKAYCSEAYYKVAADNIQLHGGIGFTWEHDCHLFFKRATASLQYLGSPQFHRELLARPSTCSAC